MAQVSATLRATSCGMTTGAVAVGVNQVVGLHFHAADVDLDVEVDHVNPGMGRLDRAGKGLEAGRPGVDIADAAVGDDADRAKALMDVGLHFAPERAVALDRVEVMDAHHCGLRAVLDVLVAG